MTLRLLIELLFTFFKIGLFTFGGGYAMIPLITEEVTNKGWLDYAQIFDFIAISESTPGPFAINIATYVGYTQGTDFWTGLSGAIMATIGVILPSFIIIIIIAKAFHRFADNKYVIGFLKGVKPIIVGVITSVAISFLLKSIFSLEVTDFNNFEFKWETLFIFIVVFSMTKIWKKVHPVFVVLLSGIMGLVIYGLILV
ncbi:MAG: chromate transporter [Candidatus Izemoplasmatales bacterium]|nr:chromate transporter [Candidatus Izemoplasmatales bacterium]